MAVGSQSIALKYPELAEGFRQVRQHNPKGFIFANMGAGHSLENAQKAVEMLSADALEIHINTGQELVMKDSEGDRLFYWLENINRIAENLDVPVVVKEVGFGMSQKCLSSLAKQPSLALMLAVKVAQILHGLRVDGAQHLKLK